MRRIPVLIASLVVASSASCGGEQPAPQEAPAAAPVPMLMPADWIRTDEAARTVTLDLVAGQSAANGGWNFNGYANGDATVVVPEGYTVTINFSNEDAKAVHSVGVAQKMSGPIPVTLEPTAVFEGAMSSNPSSTTDGTRQGTTETITFMASPAGEYALASFVPGQATAGMWIGFKVVAGATSAMLEMIM